jgi:hypothetical protein
MDTENLNIYVFTTKFVLKENSPILKVYHDSEGDWQFLGKETNLKEDDAMVVSLDEILKFDPSLQQLLNLPIDSMAYRVDQKSIWIFDK